MKNFTRKLKSKKAYTLVELIVTIAIIGITAGFGVGIFASTLRNYSAASVTATDQEKANQIESFIVRNARTATDVYYLDDRINSASYAYEKDNKALNVNTFQTEGKEAAVITHGKNDELKFKTFYLSKDEANPTAVATLDNSYTNFYGVSQITFTVRKQYQTPNNDTAPCLYILYYLIEMDGGYTLRGSTILYNCQSFEVPGGDDDQYVVTSTPYTVGGNSIDTGIVFVKGKDIS